jgi:hypothetical protein
MASIIKSDNGVSSGITGIVQSADSSGQLVLQTTTSGGTATTAVTIDNSQNVGIGTSSPAAKLDVNGNVYVRSSNNLYTNGIYAYDSDVNISTNSSGSQAIKFSTGSAGAGTERMRIDSGGNLLVGTTSQVNNALTTLTSSTARSSLALACTTANQGNNVLYIQKFDNTTTTGTVFVAFAINNGSNGSGQINANGPAAAAFGSYSDSRLKENIVDLPSQLSNIMALRPVEFDYIESEGGGHQIGFIAQEMQTIYPDAVGERAPDNMLSITGWSKTEARLVKAIQELSAQVTSLQATVETQATTIATLQNKIGA